VNDSGQVVGWARQFAPYPSLGWIRPFLWTRATGLVDLGDFGGRQGIAHAINSIGQVVGGTEDNQALRAFLWESATGLINLNTFIDPASAWNLSVARGINENGWIVGYGVAPNGEERAFLLTAVPEPRGLLVMCIGLAIVLHLYKARWTLYEGQGVRESRPS